MNELYFNGIDGSTGEYLLPPMTEADLCDLLFGVFEDPIGKQVGITDPLEARVNRGENIHLALEAGYNPDDLADAGWGIVFAKDIDPKVVEALDPLVKLRQEQAKDRFYSSTGEGNYLPEFEKGMSADRFCELLEIDIGFPINPKNAPYYLLFVGSPEQISFEVTFHLSLQFAVGRLDFEDPNDYEKYARSVVSSEGLHVAPSAHLFGVENGNDQATYLSSRFMIPPIERNLKIANPNWSIRKERPRDATRDRFLSVLGEDQPALFLTASHGLDFRDDREKQKEFQGSLLCSDFKKGGALEREHYVSGEDIRNSGISMSGQIGFLFACHSLGTPEFDDFTYAAYGTPKQIADDPFVTSLPKEMLKSGSLAVIGHVERAWGHSFYNDDTGSQTGTIQSVLTTLMSGRRIGSAVEYLNDRAAVLGFRFAETVNRAHDKDPSVAKKAKSRLGILWLAFRDARNYMILGDPGAKINVTH